MERMLYSAPFTYGCICRLEGENAVICEFSNTTPLRDQTPLRTLANEERVSPSSQLSECQASPPARPRDSHDEEFGSKFTHSLAELTPAAFYGLIRATLVTRARRSGAITDPLSFRSPLWGLQALGQETFSSRHTATVFVQTTHPQPRLHRISKGVPAPDVPAFNPSLASRPKFHDMGQVRPLPALDAVRGVPLDSPSPSGQRVGPLGVWLLSLPSAPPSPPPWSSHRGVTPRHSVTGRGPGPGGVPLGSYDLELPADSPGREPLPT